MGSDFVKLSRAQIQYLLMIYEMLEKGPVRLRDVADALQVSKPSVHGMEEQFVRLGLLEKKRYAPVRMTAMGKQIAEEYQISLSLLSEFLAGTLHLLPDAARESAMLLLGEWSEESRERVCLHLRQRKINCLV